MHGFLNLAVLGDPIAHSRSPAIHRAALRTAGLQGDYRAIRADRESLESAIEQLKTGDLDGFNVTMPLKQDAHHMCQRLTEEASSSGSVNSLRFRDNQVEGHNTDVVAFRELFQSERFRSFDLVLLMGSGGSARAAAFAAGDRHLLVMARSTAKAGRIASGKVVEWAQPVPGALVVNATPLGMVGQPLPDGMVDVAGGLIDLPYGEAETPAIIEARRRGLPHADGVEFLARQAMSSFRWWTNINVELDVLIEAARNV